MSKFIVLEGFDGAGKSTATECVVNELNRLEIPNIQLRIPGGTIQGEKCREIVLSGVSCAESELMLIQCSRIEAWNQIIKPALDNGTWVVCDRFCPSGYAYQGAGKGLSRKYIDNIISTSTPPDLIDNVIHITCKFENALDRLNKKQKDHFENQEVDALKRIYDEYNSNELKSKYKKWYTIENNGSLDEFKTYIVEYIREIAKG